MVGNRELRGMLPIKMDVLSQGPDDQHSSANQDSTYHHGGPDHGGVNPAGSCTAGRA